MPAFDITVNGKTYHIDVPDPGAAPLLVLVDGQAFSVEVLGSRAPAPVRSLPVVAVGRQPAAPPAIAPVPAAPRAAGNGATGEILAPMPGTVLSVEVRVGQEVAAGEVVCYLEAMKMKNPLRAPRAGQVAQVLVAAGQTVGYGQPLICLS